MSQDAELGENRGGIGQGVLRGAISELKPYSWISSIILYAPGRGIRLRVREHGRA